MGICSKRALQLIVHVQGYCSYPTALNGRESVHLSICGSFFHFAKSSSIYIIAPAQQDAIYAPVSTTLFNDFFSSTNAFYLVSMRFYWKKDSTNQKDLLKC